MDDPAIKQIFPEKRLMAEKPEEQMISISLQKFVNMRSALAFARIRLDETDRESIDKIEKGDPW